MQWRARPGEPPRNPKDTETRLFCFAHAGAGSSVFRNWQKAMPPSIEVYGMVLPGREKRFQEPPQKSVEALVPALAEAIAQFGDRKIALFGHSLGGILAFEVARLLAEKYKIRPAHLIIAAVAAPQFLPPALQLHKIEKDTEFIEALARFGGMQREVFEVPELLEMLMPVLRADIEAFERHACAGTFKIPWPLAVFGGQSDTTLKPEELLGWQEHAEGPFAFELMPGDHFFPQSGERALLERLAQLLRSS